VTDEGLAASAAATDEREPTDPEGTQEGEAATPVDTAAEAEAAQSLEDDADAFAAKALTAVDSMDRDQLVELAGKLEARGIGIGEIKSRESPAKLRQRLRTALKPQEAPNA
jgi:hypothetical protein